MDEKTKAYYEDIQSRSPNNSIALPQMMVEYYLKFSEYPFKDDIKSKALSYDGTYGEWYQCLAYMIYGYGNLSNNDRRRNGLNSIRKRKGI